MNKYQKRQLASKTQNPDIAFDSKGEETIYKYFRDNFLLPIAQCRVGKYFLDFGFPDIKLALEYDGLGHRQTEEEDAKRENFIRRKGWQVFRIKKLECRDSDGVAYEPKKYIYAWTKNGELLVYHDKLVDIIYFLSIAINEQREDNEGNRDENETPKEFKRFEPPALVCPTCKRII